MERIRLSGRNSSTVPRIVYLVWGTWEQHEVKIGSVEPAITHEWGLVWKAYDTQGRYHNAWLTEWYAAEALKRARMVVREAL